MDVIDADRMLPMLCYPSLEPDADGLDHAIVGRIAIDHNRPDAPPKEHMDVCLPDLARITVEDAPTPNTSPYQSTPCNITSLSLHLRSIYRAPQAGVGRVRCLNRRIGDLDVGEVVLRHGVDRKGICKIVNMTRRIRWNSWKTDKLLS